METIRVQSEYCCKIEINKLHLKVVKHFQLDIIQVLICIKDSFAEIYYHYQYDSSKINKFGLI